MKNFGMTYKPTGVSKNIIMFDEGIKSDSGEQ